MPPEKNDLNLLKIDRSAAGHRRSGLWIFLVFFVLIAVATAAWWWFTTLPRIAEVRTSVARETSLGGERTVLNASGYVTARRRATVSSKVTGKVVEVLIEEGMTVEKDRLLARLDDTNVRANLNLATAELEATHSALAETRVLLAEAERDLKRTRALAEQGVSSQASLDNDRAEVDALEARLVRQGEDEKVAESRLAVWRQQMDDTVIRAPFEGVVVSKDAQPGEMISPVSAGGGFTRTGIGTIVDMSSLEIEVDVNESYINRVTADQPVEAVLDAYPEWRIPARVIAIVPTADRQKATVRVRIGFESLDSRILPDMGVKVAFRGTETETERVAGVAVPLEAVREENGSKVVYVVAGGRLERRAVTAGAPRGAEAVVLTGLAPGEKVMVEGPRDPMDGEKIKEKGQ